MPWECHWQMQMLPMLLNDLPPLLLFLSSTTSFFPSLFSLYWFHHWRIIVGIIRRTFNLELIRPQLPFPFPLHLAFKPNEILQKAAKKKKTWRGKWRKIPNKLRATKSKNFFLTRKRKTSLSRSVFFFFFAFFFFSFSFHSSVTFCILFRQNLKLILKLRWSFVIFLCKKFSQGVREGEGRGRGRLLRTDAHFHGSGTGTHTLRQFIMIIIYADLIRSY